MRTQETGKEQIEKGQIGNEHIPTLYTHYKLARKGTVRVQSKFAGNEQIGYSPNLQEMNKCQPKRNRQ